MAISLIWNLIRNTMRSVMKMVGTLKIVRYVESSRCGIFSTNISLSDTPVTTIIDFPKPIEFQFPAGAKFCVTCAGKKEVVMAVEPDDMRTNSVEFLRFLPNFHIPIGIEMRNLATGETKIAQGTRPLIFKLQKCTVDPSTPLKLLDIQTGNLSDIDSAKLEHHSDNWIKASLFANI
jgi:hypothetical protein